jgi:hypothetical protein
VSAVTKSTKKQREETIAEQIRALPKEMLRCRDLRHAWEVPTGFTKVEVEGGVRGALYVERVVTCRNGCGVSRVELFRIHTQWMEKLSIRYSYPKAYKLHGDKKGVHVTGIVQLELYMRSIADFNGMET